MHWIPTKTALLVASVSAALVLSACGGGGSDTTAKVTYTSMVSFGDSLSDVGTYKVGAIAAVGGGRFTVNGTTTGPVNWTELLAGQVNLSAPCPAQTGLLSNIPQIPLVAVSPNANCTNYAQGSSRVTSPAAPNSYALQVAAGQTNVGLMAALIAVALSFGGLAEIVPLMYQAETIQPLPGVTPYPALQLAGRDVYIREGCYNCHSQMVRTLRFETERYGHYSLAGESVYDRPFQWGSKRTGPDLARVGGRYSDDWQRVHLVNPRDVVPESNMPGFPWLATAPVDGDLMTKKLKALKRLGDPYTEADIAGARDAVAGKTELDALVAYLQGLGKHAPRGG